ncbi:MAG: hypothetical protein QOI39_1898, partial [Mycobacterium sp.]|nr:hypothetical protein [Mycobacterium sp.]
LLIAGVTWIVIGLAIPRFAYATVATLAILAGVFCLVAAANEVMAGAMMSSRGGRIARGLLAVLFVVAGSLRAPIMTLLTWITAGTLVHGIGEIASAFLVRGIGRHVAARQ